MSASMVATALLIFAAGAALDRRSLLQVPPASGSALGRRHFAARGFFEKKPLLGKGSDADGPRWWWRPGTDLPAVDEVVVSHEAAISHEDPNQAEHNLASDKPDGTPPNIVPGVLSSTRVRRPWPGATGTTPNLATSPPEVFVVTFADRPSLYLDALAATAMHFNRNRPLYVLGLSGARMPDARRAGQWGTIERRAVRGADPGKLKKVWFLGGLLSRDAPLGMRLQDLLLFVDGYDVLLQRQLALLPAAYEALRAHHGMPADTTFVMGEHNCWPWPQPWRDGKPRARGVSMDYMRNATFAARSDVPPHSLQQLPATRVCEEMHRRARPGTWFFPNAGVFLSSLTGARTLLAQLRGLVERGHFEDQAMVGLAMLQEPNGRIRVDSNATLFSSQYAYNGKLWARPACFADYFDAAGEPPAQVREQPDCELNKPSTCASSPSARAGAREVLSTPGPFAMHFNGPAGRYRRGWCTAELMHHAASRGQYLVDVDRDEHANMLQGGARVLLPEYCGGVLPTSTARTRTAPPPRPVRSLLPCAAAHQVRLGCANDHCLVEKYTAKDKV